uniref:EF-hand domain-containing protein n=1 Tax=Chromera velia CCMP2878 TaxID=1169474 RepID=A0A0G4HNB3_9ALVE|eukprot:Cvel_1188.t1-p1 / transcript=Cvel_1188.t1 / gene=Cvel_1188 / organism=Chromera_velia_CCMP2878 / gene_product=hypothetical protein / transcript_product=hypothetical protein / location=Cvel_scaffold39:115813-127775(-) / protein_length=1550 / sequence_SO=supercontig / SO=protein_coding / is_pseudo=false
MLKAELRQVSEAAVQGAQQEGCEEDEEINHDRLQADLTRALRAPKTSEDLQLISRLKRAFEHIDIDGNRTVSWEEFSAYLVESTASQSASDQFMQMLHLMNTDASVIVETGSKYLRLINHGGGGPGTAGGSAAKLAAGGMRERERQSEGNGCSSIGPFKTPIVAVTVALARKATDLLAVSCKDCGIYFVSVSRPIPFKQAQVWESMTDNSRTFSFGSGAESLQAQIAGSALLTGPSLAAHIERRSWRPHLHWVSAGLHSESISAISLVPSLWSLATASLDGSVCLVDAQTGQTQKRFGQQRGRRGVLALCFFPSAKVLVSGGFGYDLAVWNPYVDKQILSLQAHSAPVIAVDAVDEARGQFLSVDASGVAKVWDLDRFVCVQTVTTEEGLATPLGARTVLVIPHHKQVIVAGKYIAFFRYQRTGIPDFSDVAPIQKALLSEEQGLIVTASAQNLRFWDACSGSLRRSVTHAGGEIAAIEMDTRGRKVFVGDHKGGLTVYSLFSGAVLGSLSPHGSEVSGLSYCEGDANLLSVGWDGAVFVHDELALDPPWFSPDRDKDGAASEGGGQGGETGGGGGRKQRGKTPRGFSNSFRPTARTNQKVLRRVYRAHSGDITCCAYSRRLGLVATGSTSRVVTLWGYQKLQRVTDLLGHGAEVTAVSFLEPFPLLCSADAKGFVYIWLVPPHAYAARVVEGGDVGGIRDPLLITLFLNVESVETASPVNAIGFLFRDLEKEQTEEERERERRAQMGPASTSASMFPKRRKAKGKKSKGGGETGVDSEAQESSVAEGAISSDSEGSGEVDKEGRESKGIDREKDEDTPVDHVQEGGTPDEEEGDRDEGGGGDRDTGRVRTAPPGPRKSVKHPTQRPPKYLEERQDHPLRPSSKSTVGARSRKRQREKEKYVSLMARHRLVMEAVQVGRQRNHQGNEGEDGEEEEEGGGRGSAWPPPPPVVRPFEGIGSIPLPGGTASRAANRTINLAASTVGAASMAATRRQSMAVRTAPLLGSADECALPSLKIEKLKLGMEKRPATVFEGFFFGGQQQERDVHENMKGAVTDRPPSVPSLSARGVGTSLSRPSSRPFTSSLALSKFNTNRAASGFSTARGRVSMEEGDGTPFHPEDLPGPSSASPLSGLLDHRLTTFNILTDANARPKSTACAGTRHRPSPTEIQLSPSGDPLNDSSMSLSLTSVPKKSAQKQQRRSKDKFKEREGHLQNTRTHGSVRLSVPIAAATGRSGGRGKRHVDPRDSSAVSGMGSTSVTGGGPSLGGTRMSQGLGASPSLPHAVAMKSSPGRRETFRLLQPMTPGGAEEGRDVPGDYELLLVTGSEEGRVHVWDVRRLLWIEGVLPVAYRANWVANRISCEDWGEVAAMSARAALNHPDPVPLVKTPLVKSQASFGAHSGAMIARPACMLTGGDDKMARVWAVDGTLLGQLQQNSSDVSWRFRPLGASQHGGAGGNTSQRGEAKDPSESSNMPSKALLQKLRKLEDAELVLQREEDVGGNLHGGIHGSSSFEDSAGSSEEESHYVQNGEDEQGDGRALQGRDEEEETFLLN